MRIGLRTIIVAVTLVFAESVCKPQPQHSHHHYRVSVSRALIAACQCVVLHVLDSIVPRLFGSGISDHQHWRDIHHSSRVLHQDLLANHCAMEVGRQCRDSSDGCHWLCLWHVLFNHRHSVRCRGCQGRMLDTTAVHLVSSRGVCICCYIRI
jgi:hypothetical protein